MSSKHLLTDLKACIERANEELSYNKNIHLRCTIRICYYTKNISIDVMWNPLFQCKLIFNNVYTVTWWTWSKIILGRRLYSLYAAVPYVRTNKKNSGPNKMCDSIVVKLIKALSYGYKFKSYCQLQKAYVCRLSVAQITKIKT